MSVERSGPVAMRVASSLLLLLPLLPVAIPASSVATAGGELAAAAPAQQAAPASPSPSPGKPQASPPPRNLERIGPGDAIGVLGKQVEGSAGADMGQLVEVLVDDTGRPVAAVIDFGGFLGVGSRKIAVDWRLLEFRPGASKGSVLLHLDRAALQGAPEYKMPASPDQPIEIVGPPPAAGAAVPSDAER